MRGPNFMQNKFLSNFIVAISLFSFSFNLLLSFPVSPGKSVDEPVVAQEVITSTDDLPDELDDKEILNSLLGMFGGQGADGQDALQDFMLSFHRELQERARLDAEKKFKLLPEKFQEIFLTQQKRFKDISLSIAFENCILVLLNKIDICLNDLSVSAVNPKTERVKEVLQAVYYFLNEGYISFLISQGSLPRLQRKQEELATSFYDYNQAPFFLPFSGMGRGSKLKLSPKDKKIESFIIQKLKEFKTEIDNFKDLSIQSELNALSSILDAISEKDLSKLIDASLGFLTKEIDKNYKGLNAAEKAFESLTKSLISNSDLSEDDKQLALAAKHFLKEIKTYKKALDVFKAYKKDLKIQKSAWSAIFNNFLLVSYDLYGKIDPLNVGGDSLFGFRNKRFTIFSWDIWKNKFFGVYGWSDRAIRILTSVTTFFDYYMALKGLTLLDIMEGKGELSSLGKDGLSLLDVVNGDIDLNNFALKGFSKKEVLMFMAMFKAWYIYKVTSTFSKNIWPIESVLRYLAAFTTYHVFDKKTEIAKVFWPSEDYRIKNASFFMLSRAKNSLSHFVEVLLYITNPTLFENLEDKTLGIIRPELFRLLLDAGHPDVANYFPEQIANLKRDGRFLNYKDIYYDLGLGNDFIQIKKPINIDRLNNAVEEGEPIVIESRNKDDRTLTLNRERVEAISNLDLDVLRKEGLNKELRKQLANSEQFGAKLPKDKESKELQENLDLVSGYLPRLGLLEEPYSREEYYEGKVLGYLASSVGGHIGKSIFESKGHLLGSGLLYSAKGCTSVWDKITGSKSNQSILDVETEFREMFIMIKEVMVSLVASGHDEQVVSIFLYNLAGLGILSYSDAARFYTSIRKDMGDVLQVSLHFDDVFDSVVKRMWGRLGRFLGSIGAKWQTGNMMDQYGPFYPRIKNYIQS